MNVLITGSRGQIGTNLALRLLEKGHSVLGYHPQTSLVAGIPKAVAWCLDGWEKIQ